MVENFDGWFNLAVFSILTLGWVFYTIQMLFFTQRFFDRFNISHTGVIFGRLVGTFGLAAIALHLVILFNGVEGSWHFFAYFVVQAAAAVIASFVTVQQRVAEDEGVRYTAEPYLAPLVFGAAYGYLMFALQAKLYA